MMCQWDPGRETYLETNFTLKSEWQVILTLLYVEFIKLVICAGIFILSSSNIKCKFLIFYLTFYFRTSETYKSRKNSIINPHVPIIQLQ